MFSSIDNEFTKILSCTKFNLMIQYNLKSLDLVECGILINRLQLGFKTPYQQQIKLKFLVIAGLINDEFHFRAQVALTVVRLNDKFNLNPKLRLV